MLPLEKLHEKERGLSFFGRLLRRADGCHLKFIFDCKAESNLITVDDPQKQTRENMHLYSWREPICGKVVLTPTTASYKHNGVLIELVGVISTYSAGVKRKTFLRQQRRFEPDIITQPTPFEFNFCGKKENESFRGINVKVSYHVCVTVQRTMKNITEREEIWVTRVDEELSESQPNTSEKFSYFRETMFGPGSVLMDVGVDDVLHIEFRYNKKIFHLGERVLGKVTFKTADIDILSGEVGIVRKEYTDLDLTPSTVETETLQKYEIMDGTPIVGEVVPIRLYLNSVPRLTPTYAEVEGCFRVLYFLNLVLVSADGKRYFKQQEITLYRRRGQEAPINMQPLVKT